MSRNPFRSRSRTNSLNFFVSGYQTIRTERPYFSSEAHPDIAGRETGLLPYFEQNRATSPFSAGQSFAGLPDAGFARFSCMNSWLRLKMCASIRVMARVNLTLDKETFAELDRHTKLLGKPRATLARELLHEALASRRAASRRRQLAADYAAGREDARALLRDLESAQLELMDDEEA